MLKKITAITLSTLILLGVNGYKSEVNGSEEDIIIKRLSSTENRRSGIHCFEIIDKDTGVHYLIINSDYGASTTVMYNANGTIKHDK